MAADAREVGEILIFLASLYPRFELLAETLQAYATVLEDVPVGLLRQAVIHAGSRSRFFPAAAEIRNAAFDLLEQAAGIPLAVEAWGEVCYVRYEVPKWRMPVAEDWSHPHVYRALRAIGGYESLKKANFAADRARFLQAYADLGRRERDEARMLASVREGVGRLGLPLPVGRQGLEMSDA